MYDLRSISGRAGRVRRFSLERRARSIEAENTQNLFVRIRIQRIDAGLVALPNLTRRG